MNDANTDPLPLLSRGKFLDQLAKPSARVEDVPIPAWGGSIRVREVGADRRFEIEDAISGSGEWKDRNLGERLAFLLRLTAVDADGEPLVDASDLARIGAQPPSVLWPIFRAICRVNVLGSEEAAALEGESAAEPSGDSPSASPSRSASITPGDSSSV